MSVDTLSLSGLLASAGAVEQEIEDLQDLAREKAREYSRIVDSIRDAVGEQIFSCDGKFWRVDGDSLVEVQVNTEVEKTWDWVR